MPKVTLHASEVAEALYAKFSDIHNFPEYCRVCIKIPDKDGSLIPFILNRVQLAVFGWIIEEYDAGRPVRMIILKARQMGLSTMIQALMRWFVTFHSNRKAMTVAHDFDSSQNLYSMQRGFHTHSPEYFRPKVKAWNRGKIEFDNDDVNGPPGLQSAIFCETAANPNLGRSFTIQFFHGSEVASWEHVTDMYINIKALFAALNQAIPDKFNTFKFLETTAQGEGYFKSMWDRGKGYRKVFMSWIVHDEYRVDAAKAFKLSETEDSIYGDETIERQRILDEVTRWYPEYRPDRAGGRHLIEREVWCRLKWRRNMIDTTCERDKNIFRQEYPTVAEDAFLSSGQGVFDQLNLAERHHEVYDTDGNQIVIDHTRLRFDVNACDGKPDWHEYALAETEYGDIYIWEPPIPGASYVIGADCSYGVKDGDAAAMVVLKMPHLIEVASFNKSLDADTFGEQLYAIGRAYNDALLGCEINGPGLSTIHRLEKLRYPRLYYMEQLQQPGNPHGRTHGWHSNIASKAFMINDMKAAIRDRVVQFNFHQTIEQLKAFRQLERGKNKSSGGGTERFGPAQGFHDDLVTASCIAVQMARQIHMTAGAQKSVNPRSFKYWTDRAADDQRFEKWAANC